MEKRNTTLNRLIFKSLFALYTYLYMLFKKNKISCESDNALIIQLGVIGDSIIYLGIIRALTQAGLKPTVLCRKAMFDFIKENLDETEIISIDIDDEKYVWKEYVNTFRLLKDRKYKRILVLDPQKWGGHYLASHICAEQKIFPYVKRNLKGARLAKAFMRELAYRRQYEAGYIVSPGTFLGRSGADLLHKIGYEDYQCKKEMIRRKQTKIALPQKSYAVVAPMARGRARCLSEVQIQGIVEYLLDKSSCYIAIVGRGKDRKYIVDALGEGRERVINYAGETSLDELIQIIENAKFVIGADSGQIHLAASLDVPSICLSGYGDYGRFLPYDYEIKSENEPICIYENEREHCFQCSARRGAIGRGNRCCQQRVRNGGNALCLGKIEMEKVYQMIERLLLSSETGEEITSCRGETTCGKEKNSEEKMLSGTA